MKKIKSILSIILEMIYLLLFTTCISTTKSEITYEYAPAGFSITTSPPCAKVEIIYSPTFLPPEIVKYDLMSLSFFNNKYEDDINKYKQDNENFNYTFTTPSKTEDIRLIKNAFQANKKLSPGYYIRICKEGYKKILYFVFASRIKQDMHWNLEPLENYRVDLIDFALYPPNDYTVLSLLYLKNKKLISKYDTKNDNKNNLIEITSAEYKSLIDYYDYFIEGIKMGFVIREIQEPITGRYDSLVSPVRYYFFNLKWQITTDYSILYYKSITFNQLIKYINMNAYSYIYDINGNITFIQRSGSDGYKVIFNYKNGSLLNKQIYYDDGSYKLEYP